MSPLGFPALHVIFFVRLTDGAPTRQAESSADERNTGGHVDNAQLISGETTRVFRSAGVEAEVQLETVPKASIRNAGELPGEGA